MPRKQTVEAETGSITAAEAFGAPPPDDVGTATTTTTAADPPWPDVAWREQDLMFLRHAHGQSTPEDVAQISAMRLSRRDLDRECNRVTAIADLLPVAGTRAELAAREATADDDRRRLAQERAAADAELAEAQARHAAQVRDIGRREKSVGDGIEKMRAAQEALSGRLLPTIAAEARQRARKAFRDAGHDDELRGAKGKLRFLQSAAAMRMVQERLEGSRRLTVPARIQHPDWLFEPGHIGYCCERPVVTKQHGVTDAEQISLAIHDRWEAKRTELAAMIPAAEADVQRLEAEFQRKREEFERGLCQFSYVQ